MFSAKNTQNESSQSSNNYSVNWFQRQSANFLMNLRPAFMGSFLKKILPLSRKSLSTLEGVFYVDIASNIGYRLLINGIYEPEMVHIIKTYLKPGSIFVDIGANEGYFSVIASKLIGIYGKVIAIEPQYRLQPIISKNIGLNECQNVVIMPVAVSDSSDIVTLHLSPDMNTGSTAVIQTTRYPLPKQEIVGMTLTEIFEQQEIDTCDFLKVDIEGWEYEAIMGSPDIFTSHRVKVIALELHPQQLSQRGLSSKQITDFLGNCGYVISPMFENTVFISPDF